MLLKRTQNYFNVNSVSNLMTAQKQILLLSGLCALCMCACTLSNSFFWGKNLHSTTTVQQSVFVSTTI